MTDNQQSEPNSLSQPSGNAYGANVYGGAHYGGGIGPYAGGYGGYGYGGQGVHGPGISFAVVMRAVRRFWFLIALLAVGGFAAGHYALTVIPPVYSADSIVEMSVRKPRILATQSAVLEDGYSRSSTDEILYSRLQKLESSTTRALVFETFREMFPSATVGDEVLNEAIFHTDLSRRKASRLISFRLEHESPEMAAGVVNAYTRATEFAVFKENKDTSDKAVAWLQTQADKSRVLLDSAEQGLLDYRRQNQLDTLENEKNTLKESSLELSKKLVEIQSETLLVQEMLDFIDDVKGDPSKVAELPAETPGRVEIAAAMDRLRVAISERNLLLSRYTAKHPEMTRRAEQITDLGKQLLKESERARASVANSLKIKNGQITSLESNLQLQAKRISEIELQTVRIHSELNALERSRDATQISYEGILKRIEEARLAADEETAIVSIIEQAVVPEKPVKPSRLIVLVVGTALGLIGGMGLGLLVEVADDRVKVLGEVEQYFGLKVMGVVPRIKKIQRHDLALASMNNKFGHITEAFAGILNFLESPQYKESARSVLVASSTPEEGKTISASNLACMFAKSGKKTLLIDFDMRRPRLAGIYRQAFEAVGEEDDEQKKRSLLHCLASGDSEHFSSLPLEGPTSNLDIITSQPSRSISAAEVMTSQAVRELMDWAHAEYDRVIIDSPPLGVINDSSVLASLVGCVVLVIRPERSRKRLVRHMLDQFNIVDANLVGAIVNDVDMSRDSFFDTKYKYMNYSYQRTYGKAG